jgi:hypothetical protein
MSRKSTSDVCENLPSASGVSPKFPHLALIAIAIGLGGLGMAAATSDAQFARGLERALSEAAIGGATQRTPYPYAMANQIAPPVSGSEAFWLDNRATAAPIHPATWRQRAISRGDLFQFGGEREHRILEVTDVRQVPLQADSAGAGAHDTAPLMMITLRDTGSPQAAPLRLLVDADSPVAGLVPLGRARQADL